MLRSTLLVLFTAALLPAADWVPLFNGTSLAGWKQTPFRGAATAMVDAKTILLPAGAPLTGITYTGTFPQTNYEIRFEAQRIAGNDFFASLTFPVGDSFATLVTGGWGGDIVGISSLDGWDASDNETRTYVNFEPKQWYKFRLRVTPDHLRVWIDEKSVVDVPIRGRSISLRRGDIGLSAPLGFASYNTAGQLRAIEYRPLN